MTSNKSQRSTPAKHYEKNHISLLKLKLLFLHEHFIASILIKFHLENRENTFSTIRQAETKKPNVNVNTKFFLIENGLKTFLFSCDKFIFTLNYPVLFKYSL